MTPFLTATSRSHCRRSARIRHRNVNHARILRHDRNARNRSSRVRRRGRHTLLRLCFGRSAFGHHDGQVAVVGGGRRFGCGFGGITLWICGGGGCRGAI
jgi:hypothetical protein